jgi:hypothetical protein
MACKSETLKRMFSFPERRNSKAVTPTGIGRQKRSGLHTASSMNTVARRRRSRDERDVGAAQKRSRTARIMLVTFGIAYDSKKRTRPLLVS